MTEAREAYETREPERPLDAAPAERTILVADDIPMFRELAALFLTRSARVVTAEDGKQALDLARKLAPDLIIADLHMPGMNGDELCSAVKADPELAKTPVIVMIGSQDGEERARVVRAGADDLLVKPLNRMGLIEAVNRFLRFAEVRGLPRIDCSLPVGVDRDRVTTWGTALNLSRGGLFVETEDPAELDWEVALRFVLPNVSREFCPTAQVMWRAERDLNPIVRGMGLRFLALDGAAERQLDDYVFHHRFSRELPEMGRLP